MTLNQLHTKETSQQSAAQTAPDRLLARLQRDRLTRLAISFLDRYQGVHLKDFVVHEMDDRRRMRVVDRWVVNFGSDSFLGLDRDRRLIDAMDQAARDWGTHNGASRAFTSTELCDQAEARLARWLDVEDTLIFTSVTLANAGLIPAICGKGDLLIVDRQSHDSIHQGARIAAAQGATVVELHPSRPDVLDDLIRRHRHSGLVLAVDGVYSMTGQIPPLAALHEVISRRGGILYVDDAHGTAVVGPNGRGAAFRELGHLNDVLMVGSLSKAFSCMGAFVTCGTTLKRVLKIRSSTFIFGGPVPPAYLAAVCAVCDILESTEHDDLIRRLNQRVHTLTTGLRTAGFNVLGGETPIVSAVIGDIEKTFLAGKQVYDDGYYVQSATYPAVPITGGLLRVQVNANHDMADVEGLVESFRRLRAR